MSLTNKQKNWIVKNHKKYSVKKLAGEIGVSEDVVNKFLNSQKKKNTILFLHHPYRPANFIFCITRIGIADIWVRLQL